MNDPYKIAVVGCGKLGLPTANFLISLGHDVRRFDTAHDFGYTHAQACEDRDLILIAVPTPHAAGYDGSMPISNLEPRDFDYSLLESAVNAASTAAPSTPIVIISTCLPGTTRRLFSGLPNEIIYNPYLISMGAVEHDLEHPDIIIFGTKDGRQTDALNMLASLHADMSGYGWMSGKIKLGTWEEAEGIKIFYNTFISAKLGLVNMIQDVAQRIGNMNVDVVTQALQTANLRITGPKYMVAGMGDGGPCHPRDNIALRWLAQELELGYDLFSAIMTAREEQAKNLALSLIEQARKHDLPIYIHGKSFKPGVAYCDGSYSLLVGHYVSELSGQQVTYIDPNTETNSPTQVKGVVLLAHNSGITYNYTGNNTQAGYCDFLPGSVIVDPWRNYVTNNKEIEVIHYGNTRRNS